jgi:hypothetical protein
MTRAQKRREQRAAEDALREERIAREVAEGGDSARLVEERELSQRLANEGLALYDIPVCTLGFCFDLCGAYPTSLSSDY